MIRGRSRNGVRHGPNQKLGWLVHRYHVFFFGFVFCGVGYILHCRVGRVMGRASSVLYSSWTMAWSSIHTFPGKTPEIGRMARHGLAAVGNRTFSSCDVGHESIQA